VSGGANYTIYKRDTELRWAESSNLPAFVLGRFTFRAYPPMQDMLEYAERHQSLQFELHGDAEGPSSVGRVLMGASLSKCVDARENEHGVMTLGGSSHLVAAIRHGNVHPISLGAFGIVTSTGPDLYIKPFAIWH
jgi:hypothetical protein